jgi:cbb3-type cytochrome oxidase subunit 3
MLKNREPAFALVALFAVAVYGVSLSSRAPPYSKKISHPDQSTAKIIVSESPEDRIADYTAALALFTAVLVLVSSAQIYFLFRADKTARTAANAAKQSADFLRNIERAYVFIDYELLRERNAALKEGGISPYKQIELVFKNFGRTPAIVNGINFKCLYWQNRYLPEMKADSMKIPSGIAIGSGSPWSIPAIFKGTQRHINEAMGGAGSIYLYGEIAYRDMLGEQRETGFCCEWNFAEAHFFMAPNTKLNYHT